MGPGLIIRNAIGARVRENIVSRWQGLTPASYVAAEKSEWRMALKI